MADARQYDSGFTIRLTIEENASAVDLSTATKTGFTLRAPRGLRELQVSASFFTDGTDGILEYVIQPGELTISGQWQVFPVLEFPGGLNLRGTGVALDVEAAPEA